MNSKSPMTIGAHHIGLTVSELEKSARFFIDVLAWNEVKRIPDYPAIFVSDGVLMVTLWGIKPETSQAFNKDVNVGLHHLALRVQSFDDIENIHTRVAEYGLRIEFSPELLGEGPAKHMMFYEPGGIRIEIICVP